jgi:predicted metal-dependent hydrolase
MNDICQEVKGFLESLRRDLPTLFQRGPLPKCGARPANPSSGPVARPASRLAADFTEIGRKKAGEIIKERIESIGSSMGLEYGRVFIKDQKTLWASCSGKRNLNFNWRLAAAPPEILDYVVIHELCHLREMNHSKRFWRLVGESCPDHKARKKWLRDNSARLRTEAA